MLSSRTREMLIALAFVIGVVSALIKDGNSKVRSAVVRQLEKWGSPATEQPLVEMLQDPVADIRRRAVRALKSYDGSPNRVELITEMLQDKNASVRAAAQRCLDKINPIIHCIYCNLDYGMAETSTDYVEEGSPYSDCYGIMNCPEGHRLRRWRVP